MTATEATPPADADVREGQILALHLVGAGFPEVIPARYAECIQKKRGDGIAETPDPLTAFALKHPIWIGPLDTFLGLAVRRHDLRKRLLVMAALMECTPEYADRFLAERIGFGDLLLLGLRLGPVIAIKAVLGALVYSFHSLTSRV